MSDPHPTTVGWTRQVHLDDFCRTWWKNRDGIPPTNGTLFLPSQVLWEATVDLTFTDGHILVRKEYVDMYQRLIEAAKLPMSARVLLGSPGIGKSYFLLYALIRRLAEGCITLLTDNGGIVLLFHPQGVFSLEANEFTPDHLDPFLTSSFPLDRPWSLIDAAQALQEPPPQLTAIDAIFPVQAVSPDKRRYKEWKKQRMAITWIMQAWEDEELPAGLALHVNPRARIADPQKILKLREEFGPCIRDVAKAILSPAKSRRQMIQAAQQLKSVDQLLCLITGTETSSDQLSHQLFIVRRLATVNTMDDTDDRITDFKSIATMRMIVNHYRNLQIQDALRVYNVCTFTAFPETSYLAGWAFERLAIHYTCGAAPDQFGSLRGCYPMRTACQENNHFVYSSPGPTSSELQVASHTLKVVVSPEGGSTTLLFKPLRKELPVKQPGRNVVRTRSLEDVVNLDSSYYVPATKNHPLFDAFFERQSDDAYVLWVVQMMTSARHGGSGDGYAVVRELRSKALCSAVKYVLVVPERANRRVSWTLPEGWGNDVEGEVYVQHLYLDGMD